ncbi:MAG: hypothetical protein OHK0013_11830 [Sandaracinaceae bacterium]
MSPRLVSNREELSQRRVAFVRRLVADARRAGLADFSQRRAIDLVSRLPLRAGTRDVCAALAAEPAHRWSEPLDSRRVHALERAVRRATARDGLPPARAGRKRRGARTPPIIDFDDGSLHFDDAFDAMLERAHAELDELIAQVEVRVDETFEDRARAR